MVNHKVKAFKILQPQQKKKTNMQNEGSDKENLVTVMQIAKMYQILSTRIFLSCLNSFSSKSLASCSYMIMSLADAILEWFLPDQINSICWV